MNIAFQPTGFQPDAFQTNPVETPTIGFQPCAFQPGAFQTEVCDSQPVEIKKGGVSKYQKKIKNEDDEIILLISAFFAMPENSYRQYFDAKEIDMKTGGKC